MNRPRVVMVNGWRCPPGCWGGLDDAVRAAGFAAEIADPPEEVLRGGPRDIAAWLAVTATGPVHGVVGYSLGAQVAPLLARAMHPAPQRVVMLAPPVAPLAPRTWLPRDARQLAGVPGLGGALFLAALAAVARRPARLEGAYRRAAGTPDAVDREPLAGFVAATTRTITTSSLRVAAASLAATLRLDLRPCAPTVPGAVLVCCGEHDPLAPPAAGRDFAAAVPDGRCAEVPGAGHFPHLEDPAGVAALVVGHLRG
ncbi:MAG: alpha/beta hydrolase [Thermoleophilia bacterium]|nr:alpha/beta hydrolase [Thermoleophilia bacterium]